MIRTFSSLPRLNQFLGESDHIVKAVLISGGEFAVEIKGGPDVGRTLHSDKVQSENSPIWAEPRLMDGIPPRGV